MTRTEVAVVALIVVVIAWLLMPPPVAPADAGEIVPCPMMYTPERGAYGGCMVYLPIVVNCGECLRAWPVEPGGTR